MQISLITDKEAELHEGYSAVSELQSVQVCTIHGLGVMVILSEIITRPVHSRLKISTSVPL